MNWQEHIIEDAEDARLDRYLKRIFPSLTQGIIERAIRKKDIRVNGKKPSSSMRVHNGDTISYFANIISTEPGVDNDCDNKVYSRNVISLAEKIIGEYLIYQSEYFIAIDKPHGLPVQGGSKISISVDHALQYLNDTKAMQLKLVHRLDKDTSGVLLIARGYNNAMKLTKAFKDKLIVKLYLAQLHGIPEDSCGIIDNYIGKSNTNDSNLDSKEMMCILDENSGKRAITRYKVIEKNYDSNTSIVEFSPETGRTHQLRVHSKHLGCSIVGDVKYGGSKSQRMMLHAKKLILLKGIFDKEITIESQSYW